MKVLALLGLAALLTLAGCRSHMITVKLTNSSAQPVSTIIVDYPSATFGKDRLAPGETFVSQIRITDSGPIKVQFTDAKGGNHTYTGPNLHPNYEGSIEIKLDQDNATASSNSTDL